VDFEGNIRQGEKSLPVGLCIFALKAGHKRREVVFREEYEGSSVTT
jgi:hypothetical protein